MITKTQVLPFLNHEYFGNFSFHVLGSKNKNNAYYCKNYTKRFIEYFRISMTFFMCHH